MRCACCDTELSDYECSLRSASTDQYLDMCGTCISESGITPVSYSRNVVPDIEEEFDNLEQYRDEEDEE